MMGEQRLPKKAFSWDPPRRKKRDGPVKTWLYGVLEDTEKERFQIIYRRIGMEIENTEEIPRR